jgi:hypothetical protein
MGVDVGLLCFEAVWACMWVFRYLSTSPQCNNPEDQC